MMRKLPSKATIIRTAVLGLALVNNALALAGKSPLPFDNEDVTSTVSFAFTVVASATAWWNNNSFTQKAIEADDILKK